MFMLRAPKVCATCKRSGHSSPAGQADEWLYSTKPAHYTHCAHSHGRLRVIMLRPSLHSRRLTFYNRQHYTVLLFRPRQKSPNPRPPRVTRLLMSSRHVVIRPRDGQSIASAAVCLMKTKLLFRPDAPFNTTYWKKKK